MKIIEAELSFYDNFFATATPAQIADVAETIPLAIEVANCLDKLKDNYE